MLIKFRVSNYRSFGKLQEFSMVAGSPRLKMSHLARIGDIDLLKFTAIYGANAAGKSNIVRAINFAKNAVVNGLEKIDDSEYCHLNDDSMNKPWSEEISTFDFDIYLDGKYYTYGFDVIISNKEIRSEWLYEIIDTEKGTENLIFERKLLEYSESTHFDPKTRYMERKIEFNYSLKTKSDFKPETKQVLELYDKANGNKPTKLFLSIMDYKENNLSSVYPDLKEIFRVNQWFNNELSVIFPPNSEPKYKTENRFSSFSYQVPDPAKLQVPFSIDEFKKILIEMGLGINDVEISEIKTVKDLRDIFSNDETKIWEAYIPKDLGNRRGDVEVISAPESFKMRIQEILSEIHSEDKNAPNNEDELSFYFKCISNDLIKEKENLKAINGYRFMSGKTGTTYLLSEIIPDYSNIYTSIDEAEADLLNKVRKGTRLLKLFNKYSEYKRKYEAISRRETNKENRIRKTIEDYQESIVLPDNRAKLIRLENGLVFYAVENGKPVLYNVTFKHGERNVSFSFRDESDGTRRMIDLIEILCTAKEKGNHTFIIDEIDRSLHPQLTEQIVKLFLEYCSEGGNVQLIVTTHEARLMDLSHLRQDEIWFVDKNAASGYSELYSLDDFNERTDRKIDKAYFDGRYGGIPLFNMYFPKVSDTNVIDYKELPPVEDNNSVSDDESYLWDEDISIETKGD